MGEIQKQMLDVARLHGPAAREGIASEIHPAWLRLIKYCADLGHGEIEKLKIQDGLPMVAEITTRKIKFSP
jgi:hypothetical protein